MPKLHIAMMLPHQVVVLPTYISLYVHFFQFQVCHFFLKSKFAYCPRCIAVIVTRAVKQNSIAIKTLAFLNYLNPTPFKYETHVKY